MAHKDVIPVSAFENDDAKSYLRIIQAIMDDNPLLYFLNQSRMDLAQDANGTYAVMPQYFFSQENIAAYNQKIQDAANAIIYDLKLTEGGSDLEKVRKVHDYMCQKITYDYGGANVKDVSRFIAAHNIIGVFAHQKAQCEGIAKAAKVLLNAVDVRCIVLFGEAADETGKMTDHAWNIVKLGGIFIVKTAIATGILSLCIELSERFVPQFTVNKILASIFGGIVMGAGLSLILKRGATTGGSDILIPALGATLAGAVYGDHCSPISDTTILASTGAQCPHIRHVETQIPYATLVAVVCAVGYLIIGFTHTPWIGLGIGSILLTGSLLILSRKMTAA